MFEILVFTQAISLSLCFVKYQTLLSSSHFMFRKQKNINISLFFFMSVCIIRNVYLCRIIFSFFSSIIISIENIYCYGIENQNNNNDNNNEEFHNFQTHNRFSMKMKWKVIIKKKKKRNSFRNFCPFIIE